MKHILISDLHFTEKIQDAYRWRLFNLVIAVAESLGITSLKILGDITNAKDGHCSALVNPIADGIAEWAEHFEQVDIMCGNHDLIGEGAVPYFHFLNHLDKVRFINAPLVEDKFVYLPHTRDPVADWQNVDMSNKIVMAHVSVDGAVFESGIPLKDSGITDKLFKSARLAFSGDIHSRQTVGYLNYIGCPFRVRFNDQFQGGAIVLDDETFEWEWIDFDFINRHTLDVKDSSDFANKIQHVCAGDQIKVVIRITAENMGKRRDLIDEIQHECAQREIELCGIRTVKEFQTTIEVKSAADRKFSDFDTFCKRQLITPELVAVGKALITEAEECST